MTITPENNGVAVTKEEMFSQFATWGFAGGAGIMGRLMFHAKQVQAGIRKPFSWVLFWDLPIGICMGWIALGLGTWLGLQWEVVVSLGMAVAYMGPYGIDTLFAKWADWKFTKEDTHGD